MLARSAIGPDHKCIDIAIVDWILKALLEALKENIEKSALRAGLFVHLPAVAGQRFVASIMSVDVEEDMFYDEPV